MLIRKEELEIIAQPEIDLVAAADNVAQPLTDSLGASCEPTEERPALRGDRDRARSRRTLLEDTAPVSAHLDKMGSS